MKNLVPDFKRYDKQAGVFCTENGLKQEQLRDWRKRGMVNFLGDIQSNGNWGYSKCDALTVELAKGYQKSGFDWKKALWMGYVTQRYILDWHVTGGEPKDVKTYLVFSDDGQGGLRHENGKDLERIFDLVLLRSKPPVLHVVNLVWTFINLPKRFQDDLNEIARAA